MTRLASQPRQSTRSGSSATSSGASMRSASALRRVREVLLTVRAWPGLTVLPDAKGVRLEVGGATIGRLHLTGLLEAHVGAELARQLLLDGTANRHPENPADPDRVAYLLQGAAGVSRAVWLLRLAYLALDPELDLRASDVASGPAARAA